HSAHRPPTPTPLPYTTLFRSIIRHDARSRSEIADTTKLTLPDHSSRISGVVCFGPGFQIDTIDISAPAFCRLRSSRLINVSVLRSEEHTSEFQSRENLVCRLL